MRRISCLSFNDTLPRTYSALGSWSFGPWLSRNLCIDSLDKFSDSSEGHIDFIYRKNHRFPFLRTSVSVRDVVSSADDSLQFRHLVNFKKLDLENTVKHGFNLWEVVKNNIQKVFPNDRLIISLPVNYVINVVSFLPEVAVLSGKSISQFGIIDNDVDECVGQVALHCRDDARIDLSIEHLLQCCIYGVNEGQARKRVDGLLECFERGDILGDRACEGFIEFKSTLNLPAFGTPANIDSVLYRLLPFVRLVLGTQPPDTSRALATDGIRR